MLILNTSTLLLFPGKGSNKASKLWSPVYTVTKSEFEVV